jgi:hypothetical protein
VLDLAEWQVEGLARMAGRAGGDVGARWGKPPSPRRPMDDGLFDLPYEVKRQGILGRMLKEWEPDTS